MTTNNDTPQVFGQDPPDDDPDGPDVPGRGRRVEPEAPDDYQRPSSGPQQPDAPELDAEPAGSEQPDPERAEYPRIPGYAPVPMDYPGPDAYPAADGFELPEDFHQPPRYPGPADYRDADRGLGAGSGPDENGYPARPPDPREAGYSRAAGYPGNAYPASAYRAGAYPDDAYPDEADYPLDSGYPGRRDDSGYPAEPGYPVEPGYPLDPRYGRDAIDPLQAGYAPDAGYETGYPDRHGAGNGTRPATSNGNVYPDVGYAPQPGYAPDVSYAPDTDYGRDADAGAFPLMEPPPAAPARPAVAPPPPPETSDSLTTESLLHGKRPAPGSGWRRNVSRATGGLLKLGESNAQLRRRELVNRARTPVAGGHHRLAVLSLKGGVGKTTTTVGLGATLATLRGDRVIAVDANPDRGTLSDKVRLETAATIRDMLNEREQISRYADVRAFTSQAPSRLEVLASDRDPGVSIAFGADDYCDASRVLEHFYSICLTDCGTGLLHSAMTGVLRLADQIVLVSSPSVDGARSASATLDWLEAHQCGDLVRNGVVVLSSIRAKSKSTVDLDRLEQHFASRCRAVVRIPWDPHLDEGAEVELEYLQTHTADAFLTLAAIVGDGFAWPRRATSRLALP